MVRAALRALSVFSVGAASIYFLMAFAALKELSICTGFAIVNIRRVAGLAVVREFYKAAQVVLSKSIALVAFSTFVSISNFAVLGGSWASSASHTQSFFMASPVFDVTQPGCTVHRSSRVQSPAIC